MLEQDGYVNTHNPAYLHFLSLWQPKFTEWITMQLERDMTIAAPSMISTNIMPERDDDINTQNFALILLIHFLSLFQSFQTID